MVKQFPEEAVLRRRAYFHALDLTKDAPHAPARHRPQGLSHRVWSSAGVSRLVRGFTLPHALRVGLIEIGLSARGVGDDVLDLRRIPLLVSVNFVSPIRNELSLISTS